MRAPKWIHQVFLSFHGQDTRKSFISHLYHTLQKAKINTLIDSEIPRGNNISSSLFGAIEFSKIAIIVFSPNFASSTWCLEEVAKIMECRPYRNLLVLPVFYHVDPSDVRKQKGVFEPIFAKLEEDFKNDLHMVERWRSALYEIANIAGWHIDGNVDEAEVIQKIVHEVEVNSKLLKSKL